MDGDTMRRIVSFNLGDLEPHPEEASPSTVAKANRIRPDPLPE
mgnify:FL=1